MFKVFLLSTLLTLSAALSASTCTPPSDGQNASKIANWANSATIRLAHLDMNSDTIPDDLLYRYNPGNLYNQWIEIRFNDLKEKNNTSKRIRFKIPSDMVYGFAQNLVQLTKQDEWDQYGVTFINYDNPSLSGDAEYLTLDITEAAQIAEDMNEGEIVTIESNNVHVIPQEHFEQSRLGLWDKFTYWFRDFNRIPHYYSPRFEWEQGGNSVLFYVKMSTQWFKGSTGTLEYSGTTTDGTSINVQHLAFCGTLGSDPHRCSYSESKIIDGYTWSRVNYWFSVPCGHFWLAVYEWKYKLENDHTLTQVGQRHVGSEFFSISCNPATPYQPPRG